MEELCKKCTQQDDEGYLFFFPLRDCPYIKKVYKLPEKWANDAKKNNESVEMKWFHLGVCKCADDLVEAFENV
jgi:hypothetical protein